ncbi:hypothetical protein PVK06_035372 [Gossypium arboreum]|uniref:Uncharacterized protein n=1 Tax=Gossypium arboreum TaxID=29729 RepID=A0ABR0NJP7_GOSAR|nr:hypothetical protein PVK06_035372 [Gossypium arboreum]
MHQEIHESCFRKIKITHAPKEMSLEFCLMKSFKDRRNQQLKSYLNCRREQCHSTSDAKPCKVGTVRICHLGGAMVLLHARKCEGGSGHGKDNGGWKMLKEDFDW